jgi:hypothetical protein
MLAYHLGKTGSLFAKMLSGGAAAAQSPSALAGAARARLDADSFSDLLKPINFSALIDAA